MGFNEIELKTMSINPFAMLDDDWALITAGSADKHNTMTISWGTMGILWNKPVVTVFVRPQRYTKEFVDSSAFFTVCFFPEKYRPALDLLGRKSGRDGDKIAESGLTPYAIDDTVAFDEAHTVFVCKKLYGGQGLDESLFIDTEIARKNYPGKDYHYFYFGEIVKTLAK